GTPYHTHYERDGLERVKWVDEDVALGAKALRTVYTYDDSLSPAGTLETPSQIDYPNGRRDQFTQFDRNSGEPTDRLLDATNAVPEHRYAKYDTFGRVIEEGEVGRFVQRYLYDPNDVWRLAGVGHQQVQDSTKPWIDNSIQSHLIDDELVIDSVAEPT